MPKHLKIAGMILLLVVGVGAALFFAQPKQPVDTADAHQDMEHETDGPDLLKAEPSSYDWGTISMKNGKVRNTFVVKNTMDEAITLSKLYTSCMCTEAFIKINGKEDGPFGMQGHGASKSVNQNLEPNQIAEIIVEFDPAAHGPAGIGLIERETILESSIGKLVTIPTKATVTP